MINHGLAAAGLGCIVYSAWMVHPALAWLAGGLALVIIGMGGAKLDALKPKGANDKE